MKVDVRVTKNSKQLSVDNREARGMENEEESGGDASQSEDSLVITAQNYHKNNRS